MRTSRIKYAIAFSLLLCIEVLIALYVNDRWIRPYVGDILVVVVLYCGIRIAIPNKIVLLPAYIFLFAVIVECLQKLQLVKVLGLENNVFARTLIGTTFDWKDIVCYGIGCVLLGVFEIIKHKNSNRHN